MTEATTAQDFLDAIEDMLGELGLARTMRLVSYGSIDKDNPGAGRPQTTADHEVQAILYDYSDSQIDGTTILQGDRKAIIAVDTLTSANIDDILPNMELIDGSTVYKIVRATPVEVAGEKVTVCLQIR